MHADVFAILSYGLHVSGAVSYQFGVVGVGVLVIWVLFSRYSSFCTFLIVGNIQRLYPGVRSEDMLDCGGLAVRGSVVRIILNGCP